ncbi:phage tail protein [Lapidilactobacillus luobeiensis]|uniref:phage tail protein n=1 Tax=Lapidilactobacillus luobeiensis TaxID=2950371 RepID=UPI0021C2BEEC|nr:phage tail protein [Lapidilactobacillus luobeiensis]
MNLDLQRFAADADASQGLLATGTTLGYKVHGDSSTEYTLLEDVKTIPEIGQSPEKVDVTVLTDKKKKAINGLQDSSSLAFACVYKGANFKAANGISDNGKVYDWIVTYPDGMTCTFTGQASIKIGQAGINEPITFTVTVVVSDGPDFVDVPSEPEP